MPSEELTQALRSADLVAEIVRSGRHSRPRIHHREGPLHYWTTGPEIQTTDHTQGGNHEDSNGTTEKTSTTG